MELISADMFLPYVNQPFYILGCIDADHSLVLTEVKVFEKQAPIKRQPFSLLFAGPKQPVYPQATYEFHHPEFGKMDIFIVPVGQDLQSTLYQAVFS